MMFSITLHDALSMKDGSSEDGSAHVLVDPVRVAAFFHKPLWDLCPDKAAKQLNT